MAAISWRIQTVSLPRVPFQPFDLWPSAVESPRPSPFIFRSGVVWCRFALSGLVATRCKWLFKLIIIKFKVQFLSCSSHILVLKSYTCQVATTVNSPGQSISIIAGSSIDQCCGLASNSKTQTTNPFCSPDTHIPMHPPITATCGLSLVAVHGFLIAVPSLLEHRL